MARTEGTPQGFDPKKLAQMLGSDAIRAAAEGTTLLDRAADIKDATNRVAARRHAEGRRYLQRRG